MTGAELRASRLPSPLQARALGGRGSRGPNARASAALLHRPGWRRHETNCHAMLLLARAALRAHDGPIFLTSFALTSACSLDSLAAAEASQARSAHSARTRATHCSTSASWCR